MHSGFLHAFCGVLVALNSLFSALPLPTGPTPFHELTLPSQPGPQPPALSLKAEQDPYLRFNQAGYLPGDSKVALALSSQNLAGQTFSLRDSQDQVLFSAPLGLDRGVYGPFAHLYELDFSAYRQPGLVTLALGASRSAPFIIGGQAYQDLIPATLTFFRFQRCGDTQPAGHAVCHANDGVIANGPQKGKSRNTSGGWHDAGDYLKFTQTSGYAVNLMLSAYLRRPDVFAPAQPGQTPQVLQEARVGLDWLYKLWDPQRKILYYQVGNANDHNEWRLPEADNNGPRRKIYAVGPGRGANVAGKMAAAFAQAAVIWGNPQAPYADPALAARYLKAARQLYSFGKTHTRAQASNPSDFYTETTWRDDLALAGAELYRATGEAKYLREAKKLAVKAGPGGGVYWGDLHALAHYEIARLDPAYRPTALKMLAGPVAQAQTASLAQPFNAGVEKFYWGSLEGMAGLALQAAWYQDLSGAQTYQPFITAQRDYIFGRNPWGVSFVNSLGSNWPKNPHHQVADINQLNLTGFWDEGPMTLQEWQEQEIELRGPDAYALFQTAEAVYHDDTADYATNEPTITMNAAGLALSAWLLP
jgi:hypothetical protein